MPFLVCNVIGYVIKHALYESTVIFINVQYILHL